MLKNIIKNSTNSPSKLLLFCIHIILLFFLPYTLPFFLYTLIGYGFGRSIGLFGAKAIACGFCIWLGLYTAVSHLFAKYYLYGNFTCLALFLMSVLFSSMVLFLKKEDVAQASKTINFKEVFISVLPILILFIIFFVHNRIFWIAKHFNGPYSNLIQIAQHLIREKGIYFLTPDEDVYTNLQGWYPPLISYLITPAIIIFKNSSLFIFCSILSPYIFLLGIAAFLSLFEKNKNDFLIVSWLIISMCCTYSWFTLVSEFSMETPAFLILTSFLVIFIFIYSNHDFKYVIGIILLLISIFWFRQYSGPIVILSCVLLLFNRRFRQNIIKFMDLTDFKGTFLIILLITSLFLGSLWYIDLYRITGNPFYPVQSKSKIFQFKAKDSWPNKEGNLSVGKYRATSQSVSQEVQKLEFGKVMRENLLSYENGWLYNFLSLDNESVENHKIILKFFRGFIFGYTFPTLLSILMLSGIVMFIKKYGVEEKTKGIEVLFPGLNISLCVIIAFLIFVILNGFYYKFLYFLAPFLLIFAFYAFKNFMTFLRKIKLLNYLAYPQLILFAILLLYKSVGTTTYAWAIPKYIISHDKEACNSFKAYYLYEASLRAKDRLANKDVKIMHFHAEPGIQTSLYMDRGYYWQDEHYHNNRRFMDLYRARNKNELVRLLKKKNIKVFVVTGLNKPTINEWINHDPQTRHLLPQLLLDHDSAFEFDGVFAYLKD